MDLISMMVNYLYRKYGVFKILLKNGAEVQATLKYKVI